MRVEVRATWRGPELDRLLDEDHAALEAGWTRRLARWGWETWPEVSYSRYGERGRIDLVGWHPAAGMLLIIECKTVLGDAQATLGTSMRRRGWLASWLASSICRRRQRSSRS